MIFGLIRSLLTLRNLNTPEDYAEALVKAGLAQSG